MDKKEKQRKANVAFVSIMLLSISLPTLIEELFGITPALRVAIQASLFGFGFGWLVSYYVFRNK